MKIIHINAVCGKGSTGRIVVDIANSAESHGHECYIAYGHADTDYHRAYKIGNKYEHLFHNLFFSRLLGLQGYGSILTTLKFTRWLDEINPDIVHIHNLHANYINQNILFKYLVKKDIPVIITLHDCLNFTGKCTNYTSVKCKRWHTECCRCPLIKSSGIPSVIFDWSNQIFKTKRKYYKDLNRLMSIGVSQWLSNEAKESILNTKGNNVDYIYNWIDYKAFTPCSSEEIENFRTKYGLSHDIKYLISVSQDWIEGSIRLNDALLLSSKLPNGYKLLLIGRMDSRISLPDNVTYIPYIESRHELAIAYSLSEAYIHFSIQDTFGLVIGEAMACGTIPITYDSTACGEIPAGYGIKVKPRDIDAIIDALPVLPEKKKYAYEMIDYVKNTYDKNTNISKYLNIYESIARTDG